MELADKSKNINKTTKAETTEKSKRHISKKEFLFICLFSVMVVFNYSLFNQLDIMIHNPAEFGILVSEIMWSFLLYSFLALLTAVTVLTALRYFLKKTYSYIIAVLFGFVLVSYAQVLFMNKENLSNGQIAFHTIISIFILFAPLAIYIAQNLYHFKKKKLKQENAGTKKLTSKLALFAAIIVFGMQLTGLLSAAAVNPHAVKGNALYYFSVDEQLKLSKNENVIVFVLDRFDTNLITSIFENNPETKETFSGFTHYTNNASEYANTFPSIASIFTGKVYDNKKYTKTEFLNDAWSKDNHTLLDVLKENDYIVNGLVNTLPTFYDFKDLENRFDNIKQLEKKNKSIKHGKFFDIMFNHALLRQTPNVFKKPLTNDNLDTATSCIKISNTPDYFPLRIMPEVDLKLYEKLTDPTLGLTANYDENVFSFIHLLASHGPYGYNENLQLTSSTNRTRQTIGTLKILNEYFEQMKALHIFDSSTIIVMGDHGRNTTGNVVDAAQAALFIKEPFDANGNNLAVNNVAELSHGNFASTILEIIGEDDKKTNKSYFDVRDGLKLDKTPEVIDPTGTTGIRFIGEQVRFFHNVKYINMRVSEYIASYKITGHISNKDNWKKIT